LMNCDGRKILSPLAGLRVFSGQISEGSRPRLLTVALRALLGVDGNLATRPTPLLPDHVHREDEVDADGRCRHPVLNVHRLMLT